MKLNGAVCMKGYLTLGRYRSSEPMAGGNGITLIRDEGDVFFPEGVSCLKTVRKFINSVRERYDGYRLLDVVYGVEISAVDFINNVRTNKYLGSDAISSLENTDFARRNKLRFPSLTDTISLEYYPMKEENSERYKGFLRKLDKIFGLSS